MRIKRVHIQNFRCLEDIDIEFDRVTTFIGPNGAGKSTILRALDWFFNGPKTGGLIEEDCTFGIESQRVSVEVEFCDLTEADRKELGHYATDGVDKFIAWKYREEDGSEKMTANSRVYEPFGVIRSTTGASPMKAAYREFSDNHPELSLPTATSKDAILAAMTQWELENPGELSESQEEATNFFGFNSQAKMAGFFDFVFVAADLRASEETADSKSTAIGRILEHAVNRQSADEEIATLADEVKAKQQEIYTRNFQAQLEGISDELSDAVSQYSIGRKVKVQTKDLELNPPKTQFAVSILDNTIETHVSRQGHGFQRTMIIAALQLLAKHSAAGQSSGTICLAIEEPELFQHPVQAQAFSQVLRALADDAKQIQVSYATHSPYFVDVQHFNEIRRVTRKPNADSSRAPIVSVCSSSVPDIKASLNGYAKEGTVDSQIQGVCLNRLADGLFASLVILTEGTTDRAILEGSPERSSSPWALTGVVVAEVGGKSNLFLAHAILTGLGIPVYVIFDGDKGAAARMSAQGKSSGDIATTETNNKALNRKVLKYLGETEEDWPTSKARDNYSVIEDTLETWLSVDWPEWILAKDAIVAAGQGSPDKNAQVYRLAAKQAISDPPALLEEIVARIRLLS